MSLKRCTRGRRCDRGFTLIELLVVVAIIALLISILLPSLVRAREQARRVVCGTNLRSVGTASLQYSEVNRGVLPTPKHDPDGIESVKTTNVGAMSDRDENNLGSGIFAQGTGSNMRGFFKLLVGGARAYLQPAQFVCPSAVSTVNHRRQGTEVFYYDAGGTERTYYDFNGSAGDGVEMTSFSYSFQVTIRRAATSGEYGASQGEILGMKLNNSVDSRLALGADRNPYSNSVNSPIPRGGERSGRYEFSSSVSGVVPPFEGDPLPFEDLVSQRANSRNHKREGQNVLYMDGSVRWHRTSLAGADDDCIWTNWVDSDPTVPEGCLGHRAPPEGQSYGLLRSRAIWVTDSLLIP